VIDAPPTPSTPSQAPLIVRFTDGKPGHHNQTSGLLNALETRLGTIEKHDIDVTSMRVSIFGMHHFYANAPENIPRAHLWIGAGHATHSHLLTAARYLGGLAVVCMDPGRWRRRKFDLCLIPEHDNVPPSNNVVLTRGALNHITPSDQHQPNCGVILLGGPSKHYHWDHDAVCQQVNQIATTNNSVHWHATTSRRTPQQTEQSLCALEHTNLTVTPASETPTGWVATQLATAGQCWVTEDSVSMVYEALTAGARVGILPVPRRRVSRVARGVDSLLESDTIARWDQHHVIDLTSRPAPPPMHEADRCAGIIIERFLS
jgi:uncharacterized protein